jgi:hypothetical protein
MVVRHMTTDQNIGEICLQEIALIWQVDAAAVKWVDGGFDWTPGSHLVRVRARSNEQAASEERWRVSVETDYLASIPVEDMKFIERVAVSSLATSTYSMQYPPAGEIRAEKNRKLSLFSSVYVSPELLQWLPQFFAREAIVQVANAEATSVALSEAVGGEPDLLPSGRNKSPDDILNVVSAVYVPEGKERGRWSNTDEFVKFAETYGRSDACFGNGDKSGLTLETPFGDSSALIQLHSDVEHPQLGSGLLVTIQVPFLTTIEEISKESALLNFLEANRWTDFPQLGCWQLHGDGERNDLAHTSFVPNALYSEGIATNFAFWSIARVRWLRQERWPNLEDKSMNEILQPRLALLASGKTLLCAEPPRQQERQKKKP